MLRNFQVQSQKQSLKINPQQIQFLNLLQMSEQELENHLEKEEIENPFLVKENSIEKNHSQQVYNASESKGNWIENLAGEKSFQEHLIDQLNHHRGITVEEMPIAKFIIASLNDKGYLPVSTDEIAEDYGFSQNCFLEAEEIQKVLDKIRDLEPMGIGCKCLQEYLCLQLEGDFVSQKIITKHLENIANKRFETVLENLGISESILDQKLKKIGRLRPYPAYGFAQVSQNLGLKIFPEYKIEIENGQLIGSLLKKTGKVFSVDKNYLHSIGPVKDRKVKIYLKNKLFSANWMVDAIKEREETMSLVLAEICKVQRAFFLSGGNISELKPMILNDIAQKINRTISTVSRVTSTKYIDTPFGNIAVKSLFSESIITSNGKLISNREIQDKVAQLIDKESKMHPYTDKEIGEILRKSGIDLTRRTITKYRENLNILSSKLRRKLAE